MSESASTTVKTVRKTSGSTMDPKIVTSISKQVYRRFPEVNGKKPKIRKQPLPKSGPPNKTRNFLLTYRGKVVGPGGRTIPRLIRVVANPHGKILKMSTSRG